jgi:hypothetical protein
MLPCSLARDAALITHAALAKGFAGHPASASGAVQRHRLEAGFAAACGYNSAHVAILQAELIYDAIEGSKGFYASPVDPAARSNMNIPFTIPANPDLEKAFIAEATQLGMVRLHILASITAVMHACMRLFVDPRLQQRPPCTTMHTRGRATFCRFSHTSMVLHGGVMRAAWYHVCA